MLIFRFFSNPRPYKDPSRISNFKNVKEKFYYFALNNLIFAYIYPILGFQKYNFLLPLAIRKILQPTRLFQPPCLLDTWKYLRKKILLPIVTKNIDMSNLWHVRNMAMSINFNNFYAFFISSWIFAPLSNIFCCIAKNANRFLIPDICLGLFIANRYFGWTSFNVTVHLALITIWTLFWGTRLLWLQIHVAVKFKYLITFFRGSGQTIVRKWKMKRVSWPFRPEKEMIT